MVDHFVAKSEYLALNIDELAEYQRILHFMAWKEQSYPLEDRV